jgi:1,4-alpha-glucan branching enzyme
MMKKIPFCAICLLLLLGGQMAAYAQLISIEPATAGPEDELRIIFNAAEGRGELSGAAKVYMHAGVVTESPEGTAWEHVQGNWGADDGLGEMTHVSGEEDLWEITLSPSVREYFQVPEETDIFRLAMVFRDAAGNSKASIAPGTYDWGYVAANGDMYVNLAAGPYISLLSPDQEELFIREGASFLIRAEASEEVTAMRLSVQENGDFMELESVTGGTAIEAAFTPSASGEIVVKVNASIDGAELEKVETFRVYLHAAALVEALPAGLIKGINYHEEDHTRATLVLEAPGKAFAYVVGDFNNWEVQERYLMKQTPDAELFWLELEGLEPEKEYVFQYWVEGIAKVGDPYADQVADPWNDRYIAEASYPELPAYEKTEWGVASVLQTGQQPYQWGQQEASWTAPAKEELVIYELLIRDFLETHHYRDLADTLSYLKRLGVNAIELMPVMEFEGNNSWGYNVMYHFAPDKYYGTKNDLKRFIEAAHGQGMAVILDMVLNHAFGQSPLVKMYWDPQANTVSEDSPWFNQQPTHPFNVGYDFNHESSYTQDFVDSVNTYWLEEYHFDGFRFDLSKGFTQKDNPHDVGAWSAYDASRIALLNRMADQIWAHSPDAYVILEHFADNREEKELAEYRAAEGKGMMLWGNLNHAYNQNTMGYSSDADFSWIYHGKRNWSQAHVIGYMESHDEERMMYRNLAYGNSSGDYDVTELVTALNRQKAAGLLFYTLPGPKMIWQFGELGYEYSINYCADGTIADRCRVDPKPIRWDYLEDPKRQSLFDHTADLLRLRDTYAVFTSGTASFYGNNSLLKQVSLENAEATTAPASADEMNVHMVANFDLQEMEVEVQFPHAGTWYDYYAGGKEVEVSSSPKKISLRPGGYRLYTDYPIESRIISGIGAAEKEFPLRLYPNPAQNMLYLDGAGKEVSELKLSTIQGHEYRPRRISGQQWDISSLAPGFYVVKIACAGKVYYSRIIKK